MKLFLVLNIVLSVVTRNSVHAFGSEEEAEVTETCCKYGEILSIISPDKACSIVGLPDEIEPKQIDLCTSVAQKCCLQQLQQKDECDGGIKFARLKQCLAPKSVIGKTCCDECSFGRLAGKSHGKRGCEDLDEEFLSPTNALIKKAYRQCCLETVQELETTTENKKATTTEQPKEKCKANSCDHNCTDCDGKVKCKNTEFHDTEGSFKSVSIKKRDIGVSCRPGFKRNEVNQVCDDVDECATQQANCDSTEDCVNTLGGYRCNCGFRCLGGRPTSTYLYRETAPSIIPDSSVITVGAQYGQRGPRYLGPTYPRLHDSGAVVSTCPWGYKLTPDRECVDIDECGSNISECGPQQRCENFYGGYSCQCPTGYLSNSKNCDDIDECGNGNNCSSNARCINTMGSYRCECSKGFRNAPSNDKVCEDVDECAKPVLLCEHACVNTWGGYRCNCNRGYRLNIDNRTCTDVDECAKLGSRVCTAQCLNTVGSYRCTCPSGYLLADNKRSCLDINECDNGQAQCNGVGEVCQNTRGSYHCHQMKCPSGYRLDGSQCSRIQRSCPVSDWTCLQQPSTYSYNFITFVSNLNLSLGSDLFLMRGPSWPDALFNFEMHLLDVKTARGVTPAAITCFSMRPTNNICVVSVQCSLKGPQVAELELTMSVYNGSTFVGSAVARLIVIVSEYDY